MHILYICIKLYIDIYAFNCKVAQWPKTCLVNRSELQRKLNNLTKCGNVTVCCKRIDE